MRDTTRSPRGVQYAGKTSTSIITMLDLFFTEILGDLATGLLKLTIAAAVIIGIPLATDAIANAIIASL